MILKEDSKALLSAFRFPGHLQILWLNMNKVFPHVSFPLILPLSSDMYFLGGTECYLSL